MGPGMAGRSPRAASPAGPVRWGPRWRAESPPEAEAKSGQAAPQQELVRNIGNRAFYRRNNQWIDSTLTEKQQQSPKRVKQFSDEYFALAKQFGRDMTQYLVFDEPVIVNLDGEAYLVEP